MMAIKLTSADTDANNFMSYCWSKLYNMRFLPTVLLITFSSAQLNAQKIDSPYVAPYFLPTPNGYTTEVIPFPIEFAPSINYNGVEDLRFTAGWGNAATEDYWSYAFLWWLDGSPGINEDTVTNNLKTYYSGLVGRNIKPRNIPENKIVPVQVKVTSATLTAGDVQTFEGAVYMLDYMQQEPITLHVRVHVRTCGDNKTVVFNEISPQPYTSPTWEKLDDIWNGFRCSK